MTGLVISDRVHTRDVDKALVRALRQGFQNIPGVRGALLMGSRSRSIAHAKSNVDLQLILEQLDLDTANAVIRARDRLIPEVGAPISINAHTLVDAQPTLGRYELFMHKNRAELFIYQAKYTGIPVFGRNIFAEFEDPRPARVRREAIRTVSSFSYHLRKFLFDPSMAPHGPAEFVRFPLISLEYIAGFYGYLSIGYRDSLKHLISEGRLTPDDERFLEVCACRKSGSEYDDIDRDFVLRGTRFLDSVHARMLDDFRRHAISDIRWDGVQRVAHWNLRLPQAASMTILRSGDCVLLLRRPPDDYLYPDQWTIPGGYLDAGESPSDGARRETWEETGTRPEMAELFHGRPSVSSRLAAWAFEARLPEQIPLHLTEHAGHEFVRLDDLASRSLTPEARQIINLYLAQEPS